MTQVAEKIQPWQATLDKRPTGGPRWLQDVRDESAAAFADAGFPTTRHEEWRFTGVSGIAQAEWAAAPAARLSEEQLAAFIYADAPHRLVFVNGRFSAELSRTAALPAGVRA